MRSSNGKGISIFSRDIACFDFNYKIYCFIFFYIPFLSQFFVAVDIIVPKVKKLICRVGLEIKLEKTKRDERKDERSVKEHREKWTREAVR